MHDYRERLYVPLAWWLLGMPSVVILGATLYAGLPEPWPIIIMLVLVGGSVAFLVTMGLGTVVVDGGELRTQGAVLSLATVSEVIVLDEKQSTLLRGPRADPAARIYSRPYLKRSVYLAIGQPEPGAPPPETPYWLVGSRHPEELAAVVERCRVQSGHEPVA